MKHLLQHLFSPKYFYQFSRKCLPWFSFIFFVSFFYGFIGGLILSPPDYQQGDAFRIIYLHVPFAFLSLFVYLAMALFALLGFVWKIKLADILMRASAPIGASFTLLALVTGSLWGKPMWGTYWIWDARLTSELILLFLYLGYIALTQAYPQEQQGNLAGRIIVMVGVINIPIIHYSVYWWNTLHQGATLSKFSKPSIANNMLYPLLSMIIAFLFYYLILLFLRTQREVFKKLQ